MSRAEFRQFFIYFACVWYPGIFDGICSKEGHPLPEYSGSWYLGQTGIVVVHSGGTGGEQNTLLVGY